MKIMTYAETVPVGSYWIQKWFKLRETYYKYWFQIFDAPKTNGTFKNDFSVPRNIKVS